MSNILDLLQEQLSGNTLKQLSQQIGGSTRETQSAIESALPAMLKALQKNSSNPEGAKSLANALEKDHNGSILDNLSDFINSGNDTNGGSDILKHLFGDKRKTVEKAVSEQSGLGSEATSNLMTQLGPIIMGFLGKENQKGGFDIGSLVNLVKDQFIGAKQKTGNNQQFDMITSLLDQDGDGDIKDDMINIGKKFLGGLFRR